MASFLDDPIARLLYKAANAQRNLEAPSRNFWSYILQKHSYPEPCFYMTYEHSAAGEDAHDSDRRRRVDMFLNFIEGEDGKAVCTKFLAVVGNKSPNATAAQIDELEDQGFSAARAAADLQNYCYILMTISTKYIFRHYRKDEDSFTPVFLEEEEECRTMCDRSLYSDPFEDPSRWLNYVRKTKSFPPGPIHGLGGQQAGIYQSTDYSKSSSSAPVQAPIDILDVNDQGMEIKYRGRIIRLSQDYMSIRELGYFKLHKATWVIETLHSPPQEVDIVFPFEEGRPVRQFNNNTWSTWNATNSALE